MTALALQAAPGPAPPTAGTPPPPASSAPATPAPTERRIEDLGHPLNGMVPQGSYEEGVKGAFSRRQNLQGPLDGTWTLKSAAGVGLYRVQLVDPGFSGGTIEGAWQDLRGGEASGFLTAVTRDGSKLTLQFSRPGAATVVANLDARPAGGFAGEISLTEAGKEARTTQVTLVRP